MSRVRLLQVALIILLSGATHLPAQTPDTSIVPGDRIGPWSVSSTLDSLIVALGPGYRLVTNTGISTAHAYTYPNMNLNVGFCITGRKVLQIGIYRNEHVWGLDRGWKASVRDTLVQYKTAEGIGLDSAATEAFAAYGQAARTYDWERGYKGYGLRNRIYFIADPEGKISYIAVNTANFNCP